MKPAKPNKQDIAVNSADESAETSNTVDGVGSARPSRKKPRCQQAERSASTVRDVERHLDSQWADALQDTGLTEREITALRHVVLSSLRGLALRTVLIGENATWDKELEMLKRMVHQLLTGTIQT